MLIFADWNDQNATIAALLCFFIITILGFITFMPKSFTIGEVVVISQGSTIFIFDLFISFVRKVVVGYSLHLNNMYNYNAGY